MPHGSFDGAVDDPATGTFNLHATTVELNGKAVLIAGPSASGKSALGLALMAWGCSLVADDRTILSVEQGTLVARCPASIRGMIEARGVGLLAAAYSAQAQVSLAVDMGLTETVRLPPRRHVTLLGVRIRVLHKVETVHFAAAVLQYLKTERRD